LGDELARFGLAYRNTDDVVTASIADDGAVTVAYRDPEATAAAFGHPGDRTAYLEALAGFGRNAMLFGDAMGGSLGGPRVMRLALRALRANGRRGTEQLLRDAVTSGRAYCERNFSGTEIDHLWVPWLLHAGLSPDHASGGLMIPVLAASIHGFGLPVPEGGAASLVAAFRGLFDELGVQVHTHTSADHIVVVSGRAVAVEAGPHRLWANRAVLASVTPTALYGSLLPSAASTPELREQAAAYRYGRGAMQIHVALSRPPRCVIAACLRRPSSTSATDRRAPRSHVRRPWRDYCLDALPSSSGSNLRWINHGCRPALRRCGCNYKRCHSIRAVTQRANSTPWVVEGRTSNRHSPSGC
jgi:phytoene dehydrogenase-like protein